MPGKPLKVVVAGDCPVTWRIVYDPSRVNGVPNKKSPDSVRIVPQLNGWVLMHSLLAEVLPGASFHTPQPPPISPTIGMGPLQHSITTWSLYGDEKKKVYRREQQLGWDRSAVRAAGRPTEAQFLQIENDTADPDLVVLDDWGRGYRTAQHIWPLAVGRGWSAASRRPWFLLRMSDPVVENNILCRELLHDPDTAARVILLVSTNDLRRMDIEISREMSWDQAARDVLRAVHGRRDLGWFTRAAATVFGCDDAGAMLYSQGAAFGGDPRNAVVSLCFRPKDMHWVQGGGHCGRIPGQLKCLTAAIAAQLAALPDPSNPSNARASLVNGIKDGLIAGQELFKTGYGSEAAFEHGDVRFPVAALAKWLRADVPEADFARMEPDFFKQQPDFLKNREAARKEWAEAELDYNPEGPAAAAERAASLMDRLMDRGGRPRRNPIPDDLDVKIVRQGLQDAVRGLPLPVGRFGKLATVVESEIQSYRNIGRLLTEYARGGLEKPLSIAVFGPPGSGKSFAVRELAKSLDVPGLVPEMRTFNLSQFSGPEYLLGALHQVRDIRLSGHLPIVFWDEFDCSLGETPLGWLRYFLAPMEDGQFQENQVTHPIGSAVFVFAGGTEHTFDKFNRGGQTAGRPPEVPAPAGGPTANPTEVSHIAVMRAVPEEAASAQSAVSVKWKGVKGPDFVSRLRGVLDVPGVNPESGDIDADLTCRLRRAVVLHHALREVKPGLYWNEWMNNVDRGVVNAFLRTRTYLHGVRSLKAVVGMSLVHDRQRFDRSCLPDDSQLKLHVDPADFRRLLNG